MSTAPIQATIDYINQHRDDILNNYRDLLRIPSISADKAYKAEVRRCADWVVQELRRIGFDNCRTIPTAGHPVVYGEWLKAGDDKPTALVYAHYDVQPADPFDLWESDPFEADIRDGKMYARGVSDDKAGVWGNLKVFEAMLATTGELPLNVKVMFEGEEESGSPSMESFVAAHTDLLAADVIFNCDGAFDPNNLEITCEGRGMVSAEVKVTGPVADLHSGRFGGIVQNPLHVAGKIIGAFHDADGRVQLSGYYDAVQPLDEAGRAFVDAGWNAAQMKITAGLESFWGESIAPPAERVTVFPTLDVNGMWGGYQGAGTKTIIPAEAGFKVTMRLVPDQNPQRIAGAFKQFVEGFATDTARVKVDILATAWPFKLDTEGAYVEAVQMALETATGKRAALVRIGGSIPIMGMFNRFLGVPITGFGYGGGANIHSPNEYIDVADFFLAMETAVQIYHNLAAAGKAG